MLRQHLGDWAHRLFRISGCDFRRYTPDNFVAPRRAKILDAYRIDCVLDIGADKGTYPVELRKAGYRGQVVSFEPIPQSFSILQRCAAADPRWLCENVAVGDTDGEIEMNISEHITSSSILPISENHTQAMPSSKFISRQKVRIARLDSLSERFFKTYECLCLKIDTQGYEKQVLQGAPDTLKRTSVIELELSLVSMYKGGPLLNEMLDYLSGLGFKLASLEPVFLDPQTGALLQVDGIFVR